jgi:hypothetical protein
MIYIRGLVGTPSPRVTVQMFATNLLDTPLRQTPAFWGSFLYRAPGFAEALAIRGRSESLAYPAMPR